jgi:prophage regulatory protein
MLWTSSEGRGLRPTLVLLVSDLFRQRETMANAILRLPQVKIKVGLSRSSIYSAIAEKRFPQPVRLGARAVGWLESEVDDWVSERIELRRSQA